MSLVDVKCKKCGESSKLDIGDMLKEDVDQWLEKGNGFQCFGNHVEFGSRSDYWEVDWESLQEGNAPTEQDFEEELRSKSVEVYTTKELSQLYEVNSFNYGLCFVIDKSTREEKVFNFIHSPQGTRFYYA